MTDNDTYDLDAEVEAILAHGRALEQRKALSADDGTVMHKALSRAYAKADRAHRRATERYEIKVIEC